MSTEELPTKQFDLVVTFKVPFTVFCKEVSEEHVARMVEWKLQNLLSRDSDSRLCFYGELFNHSLNQMAFVLSRYMSGGDAYIGRVPGELAEYSKIEITVETIKMVLLDREKQAHGCTNAHCLICLENIYGPQERTSTASTTES